MKEKARLSQLASRMKSVETAPASEKRKTYFGNTKDSKPLEANPPHGERGDFRKVTVTLPPAVYELLARESLRRKLAGEKDHLLASIVREAVVSHLTH